MLVGIYYNEVKESLDQGLDLANIMRIDLRALVLKSLHGNWLISTILSLKDERLWNHGIYLSVLQNYLATLSSSSMMFTCIGILPTSVS